MPGSRSVARTKPGKSTLGRLFGSEARARILTALLLGPQERYYVRDLAKRLALPPTAVSRELLTLEKGPPECGPMCLECRSERLGDSAELEHENPGVQQRRPPERHSRHIV